MSEFFLKIINMSISASWVVLVVVLLRLVLRKAPKWITVLLWGIVAVRLICPFSFESVMSLIPSAQTISPNIIMDETPEINSGIPIINNTVNPVISETLSHDAVNGENTLQIWIAILSCVWLAGITVLVIYIGISYWRIRRNIGTAVLLRKNIYQCEKVISPFVLGIINPKIYLPFNIEKQDMEYVIAHEQAHIRRKDHWWKPLGFVLLTIHWFNPIMWVGYVLLCRDIELACDENVIKEFNNEQRADYSQALLTCSVNRRMISACPLAFGEVSVKNRVRSVLNYKKPAFWIVAIAIIVSIVVSFCFLTNPVNTSDRIIKKLVNMDEYEVIEQNSQVITLSISRDDLPDSIFSKDGMMFEESEIIAYQDKTTTIFLKEVRYSNEGKENLYFCFDFAYNLKKEKGTLFYPYEILKDGFRDSFSVVDGILRTDNCKFYDAVDVRGQGPNNLICFYISTDALNQAQGIVSFDININKITYFLDAEDYSSMSDDSSDEKLENVITSDYIEQLKTKFPMYFDLHTTKGLEVYIWQMAEDSYSCGLLSGKNLDYTEEELQELHKNSASLTEMQAIVASYFPEISQNDVVIIPIQMPHSSYAYVIDEAYDDEITNIFWNGFQTYRNQMEF